ncbi:MAG TPA: hypothetical protein VLX31_00435 [Streptosporangiaceae bacterium]|nr:hypothetical protein [Streptosporangiaceae bacterium]
MATNKFWGTVSGVAFAPVAITVGVAKGAYDAASGNGSFADSAERTTGTMIKGAENFGAEHGDLITKGIITGAAVAVGGRLIRWPFR